MTHPPHIETLDLDALQNIIARQPASGRSSTSLGAAPGPPDGATLSLSKGRAALIPVLQEAQAHYGYLPELVLEEIARRLGLPLSTVYGVVTFYAQFHLTPRGRHTVRSCQGTACHVKGGRAILAAAERALGVKPGETTHDMRFTLETVACLGTCFLAPAIMVDDQYFGNLTARDVESVLEQFE